MANLEPPFIVQMKLVALLHLSPLLPPVLPDDSVVLLAKLVLALPGATFDAKLVKARGLTYLVGKVHVVNPTVQEINLGLLILISGRFRSIILQPCQARWVEQGGHCHGVVLVT